MITWLLASIAFLFGWLGGANHSSAKRGRAYERGYMRGQNDARVVRRRDEFEQPDHWGV